MLMSEIFYHKITDKQWEIIEPCLPQAKSAGRPRLDSRTVFNAILRVLESGAKWRYVPQEFGTLRAKIFWETKNAIRVFIAEHNAKACIPDKINAVIIHDFDKELYKAHNIIERFFNRIKNFRHIATRYDKLSICFLNFVLLAAVMIKI